MSRQSWNSTEQLASHWLTSFSLILNPSDNGTVAERTTDFHLRLPGEGVSKPTGVRCEMALREGEGQLLRMQ